MFDYWARSFGNIWYKSLEISWDIKFHSLNQIWTKLPIYPERDFLTVTIVYILCSIILHHFRKNHKRVNHEIVGCITLVQSEPELQFIPKRHFVGNVDQHWLCQANATHHAISFRKNPQRLNHENKATWFSPKLALVAKDFVWKID